MTKKKRRSTTPATRKRKSSKTKSPPSRPTSERKKKTSDRPTYLGLGSNVGNRPAHLRGALREIESIAPVSRCSSFFETAPEGGVAQRPFLNAVVEVRTSLSAPDLLRAVAAIERRGGRVRTIRNGPRTIDIDLLDVRGEHRRSPDLTLPHPRLHRRRFVLEPLAQIAPRWRHPRLGLTARQLMSRLLPPTGTEGARRPRRDSSATSRPTRADRAARPPARGDPQ